MTRCECVSCHSKSEHPENGCANGVKWFLRLHKVDNCKNTSESRLCQRCFDAHVQYAKTVIRWGMEGVRSPLCGECHRPIVRLSHLIEDVALV